MGKLLEETLTDDTPGRNPAHAILQDGARAFVAFGATRSLSEAAKRVGKSQPSVSRDVAGLEAALGVTLLDRSTRPIRLTPEGDALLRFLDSEQTELTHLLQGLREANAIRPSLRIGICESVAWSYADVIASRLASRLSDIRIVVASSGAMLPELDAGELDMLFCSNPFANRNDLNRIPVFEEPSILIFPKPFNLAPLGTPITWESLRTCGLPHIRCSKMNAAGQSEVNYFNTHALEFPGRIVVNENSLLLKLTAEGHGWALARPTTLAQYPDLAREVNAVPMLPPVLLRRASIITKKGARPWVADAVAGVIRDHYEASVAPAIARLVPWVRDSLYTVKTGDFGKPVRHAAVRFAAV